MLILKVTGALLFTVGLFLLFGITYEDLVKGLFRNLTRSGGSIKEEVLDGKSAKKKNYLTRQLEDVMIILEETDRMEMLPLLSMISVGLLIAGGVFSVMIGNLFMVPVMAVGCMMIPFWYVKLTASTYKREMAAELETALSVITTAYLRNEDVKTSVEENLNYIHNPICVPFKDFVNRLNFVDPDVEAALDELKGKIQNDVFKEWVDAMKGCIHDRSLKTTLIPIVKKLSDMRVVNGELAYLVAEPRKEFMTMVALVLSNIPLMYFLNKDWFDTLMFTIFGQITLAVCAAAIFICSGFVIGLSKPIEYRS